METLRQEKSEPGKTPLGASEGESRAAVKERIQHWREEAKVALDAAKKDYGQAKDAILKLQDSSELLAFLHDKLNRGKSEDETDTSEIPRRGSRKLSS